MNRISRFGPAGNSESFTTMGYKKTEQIPEYLAQFGLNAFEYQCGRGILKKMIDIWQEIYSTIKRNKLRTFLTGFAVAWGCLLYTSTAPELQSRRHCNSSISYYRG